MAKDVAEALGYMNPVQAASNLIVRNIDEFRDVHGLTKLSTPGGEQEVTILNEFGLYSFGMLAKTDTAVEFRKFVRQLVVEWRKTVMAEGVLNLSTPEPEQPTHPERSVTSMEDALILAIQALKDVRMRTDALEERVSVLQRKAEPLLPFQKSAIRTAVSDRMRWLTKNSYITSFPKIYNALNRHFQVGSYKEIPSDRCDEAVEFVRNWRPPGTPLLEQTELF